MEANSCPPLCRILSAKIGISTEYGIPDTLTSPSKITSARIGAVRFTNWNPSLMCSQGGVFAEIRAGACTFIITNPAITAM